MGTILAISALGLTGCQSTADAPKDRDLYQPKPFSSGPNHTEDGQFHRGSAGRTVDVTEPDRGDIIPPP